MYVHQMNTIANNDPSTKNRNQILNGRNKRIYFVIQEINFFYFIYSFLEF